MIYFSVGLLLGASSIYLYSVEPAYYVIGLGLFALLGVALVIKNKACKLFLSGFIGGAVWILMHTAWLVSYQLPDDYQSKTIIIQGTIASLPEYNDKRVRFDFIVDEITSSLDDAISLNKIRISWYGSLPELTPGETWQLAVRLKKPYSTQNPGGFDYQKSLFQQRIRATGYVVIGEDNQKLTTRNYSINQWRYQLSKALDKALEDHDMRGLIKGLVIGERSAISSEQWNILQDTGTSHLLAISGLHIGLVATIIAFLVAICWRLSTRLLLFLPALYAGAIAGLLGAALYSLLAGFSIPTQRALIMLVVFIGGLLNQRRWPLWHSYWLALSLVLLLDPFQVLAAGFWLSFSAVAVLLFGLSGRREKGHFLTQWLKAQWVIFVGLFSITLLLFQKISLIAPLANMIAIPWVGFIVVPLTLLASVAWFVSESAAYYLWLLSANLLDIMWIILSWLSQAKLHWQTEMSESAFLLSLFAVFLLLLPRGIPARYLATVLVLPILIPTSVPWREGEFVVDVLDVGQGLAIVIQTKHHTMIYDVGEKFNDGYDMGQAVIMPFLRHQKINTIDLIMISHHHNDHIGGLQSVYQQMPVKALMSNQLIDDRDTALCHAGNSWTWDGVVFTVVHPTKTFKGSINDRSCVLKVTNDTTSILITGDIEKRAESHLIDNDHPLLSADILIVPHHGSKTSSTQAFINAINPQIAIISAGYLNRYRLPHQSVTERYQQMNVTLLNTAKEGRIRLQQQPDTGQLLIERYRKHYRPIWHR